MPPPKGVWGIDIGQCALKALRLELVDGVPTATAFDYVEHPKILSQPDADPDQLVREALEKFLSRNETKLDQVAIGIAGQSGGLARFVKLPPVEEKKIADIVKFEAKQQIPFPLDEVVWDFQKVAGGEVMDGFAMETEIGLFAMKRDVIARNLAHYVPHKVEVHVVQMTPLALVNYATYEVLKQGGPPAPPDDTPDDTPAGKKRAVVVLDIGTEASNLIITDGGKIIWQRPVPLGGNNFTRALTKEMKLTFAKAEHLKRNAAKSPDLAQILKALKPVLTDFVGEVQRSLGYFANTHRDAHVAYMVGLGSAFRLPGLHKYLAEKLQLEVKRPSKFSRMGGEAVLADPLFSENVLTFPVAYGLALQGLGAARLTTNLLPHEIRFERLVRAKKPAAAAAAAALLLGTGALAMGYSANYSALTDAKINAAVKTAEDTGKAFTAQESKYSAAAADKAKVQDDVKAVIAGQDERLNWVRFDEVFSAALPRPGQGGNLTADRQDAFWNTTAAQRALDKFLERMKQGVPIEQVNDDDLSADLAMVNVEAVHCRWVPNLGEAVLKADDQVLKDHARNVADDMKDSEREKDEKGRWKPKGPDAAGWVVEVRGFTNHREGGVFVTRGLVKNLQRFDEFCRDDVSDGQPKPKVGQYIPGVADPVKGRVSHAFVYNYWNDASPPPTGFRNITRSYLDPLVGGTAAGGGAFPGGEGVVVPPPPAGAGGAAGGATADRVWKPLPRAVGLAEMTPAGQPGGGPGAPAEAGRPADPKDPKVRPRCEFVVMFCWREPVPSDGGDAAAAAGAADPAAAQVAPPPP